MNRFAAAWVAGALALFGCEEPKLPKSWRITYARPLGVRAEVIGDEARAMPEPGERVRVRVLIVGDEPIAELRYALIACAAAPARGELASCAGEPILTERDELGGAPSLWLELVVELDVPSEDALGDAERVLIAGTFCTDGAPELVEGGEGRCQGGDVEPVSFTAHVVLARGNVAVNHNPVIADDAIRFDDEAWTPHVPLELPSDEDAGVEADAPDAGTAVAVRADGKMHEIAISLADSARETSDPGPEELLLSHFVTGGVLGRKYSVLEREQDGREPFVVKWHMPRQDDPPARVLAVFVLRDQRGGVAYALRELEIE